MTNAAGSNTLGHKIRRVILYISVAIFIIFTLFPYFVMFVSSLKDMGEIYSMPCTLIPEVAHWENYINIWKDVPLALYFWNTIKTSVIATAITILAAVPAAYCMARMRFKGRETFRAFIIMSQTFSSTVLLMGIYRVAVNMHLQNTHLGLILILAAFNEAFAVWILSGTFATISVELEEAARIDGCSKLSALFRVILPLAAPGIVTAVIYTFTACWNEYTVTLVLIGDSALKTINIGLRAFFGYTNVEWWYVFGASLISTIPTVILFMLIEKNMTSGLTSGGVKG